MKSLNLHLSQLFSSHAVSFTTRPVCGFSSTSKEKENTGGSHTCHVWPFLLLIAVQWPFMNLFASADTCADILSGKLFCTTLTSSTACCNERSNCSASFRSSRCSSITGITPQCDNYRATGASSKCQQFLQNKLQPQRAPVPLLGEAFIYFKPTLPNNNKQCAQNPQRMTSEVLETHGSDVSLGGVYMANNRPTSSARGGVRSRFTNLFNFNCTSIVIPHSTAQRNRRLYTIALIDAGNAHMQTAAQIQERDIGTPIHLLVVNLPARPLIGGEVSPRLLPVKNNIVPALLDINHGTVVFPYLMPGNLLQASATDFATTDDLLFVYEVYEQTRPLEIAPLSGAECFAGRPNFDLAQFAVKHKLVGPTFGNFVTVAARQVDRWMILNNCRLSIQAKNSEIGLPEVFLTTAASITIQVPQAEINMAFGNEIPCKQLLALKPSQFHSQLKTFILPHDFPTPSTSRDGPPYYALLVINYGPIPGTSNSLVKVFSAYPALLYMEKNTQTRSRRTATVEVCAYQPPRVPPGEMHRIVVLAYEYTTLDKAVAAKAGSRSADLCPTKFRTQLANELGSTKILNNANFPYAATQGWQLKASNFFVATGDEVCGGEDNYTGASLNPARPSTVWSYEGATGPANWPKIQPKCGGKRQSPINIVKSHVVVDKTLGDLTLSDYDAAPAQPWEIINNGHTAQISAQFPAGTVPTLTNGGLAPQGYVFQQLHFHWGDTDNPGSEHLINYRRLPAELHIVHMRSDYAAVGGGAYTQDSGGLAVLGVMLDIGDEDNEAYEPIIQALLAVEQFNTKADVTGLMLRNLLPNRGATREDLAFYRYAGSLTTPDCYEIVQWTILQRPVMVSERQAEQLQKLVEPKHHKQNPAGKENGDGHHDNDDEDSSSDSSENKEPGHIIDNFRHSQPLNGRVVAANRIVSNAV